MRAPRRERQRSGTDAEDLLTNIPHAWKRISLISLVVVGVVLGLLTLGGWLLKGKLTPKLLDGAFGISDHVYKEVTARLVNNVDSGYSEFFQITLEPLERKHAATFYARPGQKVFATVTGHALRNLSNPPIPVDVLIDEQLWTTIYIPDSERSFSYNGNVTELMNFRNPRFADLHDIRLVPKGLSPSDEIFVRTLILVTNPSPDAEK